MALDTLSYFQPYSSVPLTPLKDLIFNNPPFHLTSAPLPFTPHLFSHYLTLIHAASRTSRSFNISITPSLTPFLPPFLLSCTPHSRPPPPALPYLCSRSLSLTFLFNQGYIRKRKWVSGGDTGGGEVNTIEV